MWEFPIVILQITIRQDFLISCDTYTSTHKRICQLQVTSRVKGTWRGNGNIVIGHIVWRDHHGTWSNRKRGTVVFLFVFLVFFTTTFTTKLSKNRKMKKTFCSLFQKFDFDFTYFKHFYTYQGRKTILWTYVPLVTQLIFVCDSFYLLWKRFCVYTMITYWCYTKVRMKLHILVINFYEIQKLQFMSLGLH